MPTIYLFGGPNGAGKTTSALSLLPAVGCGHFVNADLIARGLSPLGGNVDFQAGAIMMRRLRALRDAGEDIGTESTLASRSLLPFVRGCQERGYRLHLFYLWLPSAEVAIARVAARVRAGGHHVPDDVVRRRYRAGKRNFFSLYLPHADEWSVYDTSRVPHLVARGGRASEVVLDRETWKSIRR